MVLLVSSKFHNPMHLTNFLKITEENPLPLSEIGHFPDDLLQDVCISLRNYKRKGLCPLSSPSPLLVGSVHRYEPVPAQGFLLLKKELFLLLSLALVPVLTVKDSV